ncbi:MULTISPECIES: glycoside hydrolase family 10 protein [unclassified Synechococcus]|uniref:glycoside hydrolase family 10 protein n=1 Tax=unclassified Synechococcus TaxID=2626047 RepID=UPI0021A4846C|nr:MULTISPECIES: glycoside hydrolase family 10 protein [unclassified Synechococcus]MCT0214527.1 glycoside hydrolase family 10 protein [Synechococcus sp. CS-1326]MCT0233170.1 glycoside hydrolase family 10 protein [Synechococcus sp. CS-1327]
MKHQPLQLPLLLLLTVLLVQLSAFWLPGVAEPRAVEVRGVWMTANDMPILRDRQRLGIALDQLSRSGFNTIYPVMWNSGMTYYPSVAMQRRGFQSFTFRGLQGQDLLEELVSQGHARGLRVIPWFEFGFMVPPGSEIARLHPDWLSRTRTGGTTSISAAGEVAWLNPFHPEVKTFLSELVLEVVSGYDADGLQFDDHFSLPNAFGYDPFTVEQVRLETKKPPPAEATNPAWVQWRADRITAFLAELRQVIRSQKPQVLVSISPNYHDFAFKLQLQNWLVWVRRGLIDEVVVQVYRPDLESFASELNRPELEESRTLLPTAIGIMAGQRQSPVPMERIFAQAQAARQRGLGVAFFSFESLWERSEELVETRLQGFRTLLASPAGS